MQAQNQRKTYLDTVAGILLVYMMFTHCAQFTGTFDTKICQTLSIAFSCFMPWFFFKSGMLHKDLPSPKDEFRYTLKKLWRPYVLFWCIGFVIHDLILYIDGDKYWVHYLLSPIKQTIWDGGTNNGELAMWFLSTFFCVRVLSISIKTISGGWIACGVIGFVLCMFNKNGIIHPYYVANFFPAMFFYGMGYYMKERQFCKSILIWAIVIFIVSFIFPSVVDFRTNSMAIGQIPLWYIYAPAGIIIFNNIFKNTFTIWPFTTIGKNAMYCFLVHWPILKIIHILFEGNIQSPVTRLTVYSILLAASLIALKPIFSHTKLREWI